MLKILRNYFCIFHLNFVPFYKRKNTTTPLAVSTTGRQASRCQDGSEAEDWLRLHGACARDPTPMMRSTRFKNDGFVISSVASRTLFFLFLPCVTVPKKNTTEKLMYFFSPPRFELETKTTGQMST